MGLKAKRRRMRGEVLRVIAHRLVTGQPLPPEAIAYARKGGAIPPPIEAATKRPSSRPPRNPFYASAEWKRARYDALKRHGGRCQSCGCGAKDGARMNVDHIKPIKTHWALRLDPENLQVLCGSCNAGKGNRDTTDWRPIGT